MGTRTPSAGIEDEEPTGVIVDQSGQFPIDQFRNRRDIVERSQSLHDFLDGL